MNSEGSAGAKAGAVTAAGTEDGWKLEVGSGNAPGGPGQGRGCACLVGLERSFRECWMSAAARGLMRDSERHRGTLRSWSLAGTAEARLTGQLGARVSEWNPSVTLTR